MDKKSTPIRPGGVWRTLGQETNIPVNALQPKPPRSKRPAVSRPSHKIQIYSEQVSSVPQQTQNTIHIDDITRDRGCKDKENVYSVNENILFLRRDISSRAEIQVA